MHVVLLLAWLAQGPRCTAGEVMALADAGGRARAFDVAGAVDRLAATSADCETTRMASLYFRGLQAARDAYPNGGDETSLAPVMKAAAELERYGETNPRAELLRITLMAAAAAAQSERDDLALLLEQATTLEARMLAAGAAAAPGITVHELAGDLWLQVHRFEAARAAYGRASMLFGPTPRISLGLARVAIRLQDDAGACDAYRSLVAQWTGTGMPPELIEARAFVSSPRCAGTKAGR